jgi:adenylate kinase family enzyme
MKTGFPYKRVFGLIGAPRSGKGSVANFLTETRNFKQMAFADQIKEEFGINKEDFEAAKIAGNIKELRDELWAFSASKKKEDPMYFINKIVEKALYSNNSVVITDIRTPEEYQVMWNCFPEFIRRVYWIKRAGLDEMDNGYLKESKLKVDYIEKFRPGVRNIYNSENGGLYEFFRHLDNFFLKEDICDIYLADHLFNKISSSSKYNEIMKQYFYFLRKEV